MERNCGNCGQKDIEYCKHCDNDEYWQPKEPSPKSHECSNCGYFNSENCGECYTGNPINWIPKHSVDKQEPKSERTEGKGVSARYCANCGDKGCAGSKLGIMCGDWKPETVKTAMNHELYNEVCWLRSNFNQTGIDENALIKIAKEIIAMKKRISKQEREAVVAEIRSCAYKHGYDTDRVLDAILDKILAKGE